MILNRKYSEVIDNIGFYNVAGWGPAFVANAPQYVWFAVVSILMIQKK